MSLSKEEIEHKINELSSLVLHNRRKVHSNEYVQFIKSCYSHLITEDHTKVRSAQKNIESLQKSDLKKLNSIYKRHKKIDSNRFKTDALNLYEELKLNGKLGFSETNEKIVTEFSIIYFDYSPTPKELDKFFKKFYQIIIQE